MKLFNWFKKKPIHIECDQYEYCPTYLAYLGKYGKDSDEIKLCKNSESKYCTKYHLINQTKWIDMTEEERMKLIKDVINKI